MLQWCSVMSWYGGAKAGEKEEEGQGKGKGKGSSAKSWREGCTLGGFEMSPGNATPGSKPKKGKCLAHLPSHPRAFICATACRGTLTRAAMGAGARAQAE